MVVCFVTGVLSATVAGWPFPSPSSPSFLTLRGARCCLQCPRSRLCVCLGGLCALPWGDDRSLVPLRVLPFTLPGTPTGKPSVSWTLGSECKARRLGPCSRAHPVVSMGFPDLSRCRTSFWVEQMSLPPPGTRSASQSSGPLHRPRALGPVRLCPVLGWASRSSCFNKTTVSLFSVCFSGSLKCLILF